MSDFERELAWLRVSVLKESDDDLIDLLLSLTVVRRSAESECDFPNVTMTDIMLGVVRAELVRRGFSDSELVVTEF